MNSKQKVRKPIQLYRVLPITAVLLAAKTPGKTGDFSPRLCRGVNAGNTQSYPSKTKTIYAVLELLSLLEPK